MMWKDTVNANCRRDSSNADNSTMLSYRRASLRPHATRRGLDHRRPK
jgi:hypothetical protein